MSDGSQADTLQVTVSCLTSCNHVLLWISKFIDYNHNCLQGALCIMRWTRSMHMNAYSGIDILNDLSYSKGFFVHMWVMSRMIHSLLSECMFLCQSKILLTEHMWHMDRQIHKHIIYIQEFLFMEYIPWQLAKAIHKIYNWVHNTYTIPNLEDCTFLYP